MGRVSGEGDGYEGDKAGLGGVAVGLGWCAQQDVPSADTPGERTVARTVAPVPGPDRLGHRPGTGPGCSHHRQMGRRLRRGRACSLDIRADRGFPPALGETQQAELTGAVQKLPEMSGIEMANWTLRQAQEESGAAVCLEAFRHWAEPQHLPELSAPLGVCPEASQEASGQGR